MFFLNTEFCPKFWYIFFFSVKPKIEPAKIKKQIMKQKKEKEENLKEKDEEKKKKEETKKKGKPKQQGLFA